MEMPAKSEAWVIAKYVAGVVGVVGLAMYPIFIYPMLNKDEYKRIQEITRQGMDREAIQPGGMKIWSDPFSSK